MDREGGNNPQADPTSKGYEPGGDLCPMARVSRPEGRSRSPDYLVGLGGAVATRGTKTNKPSKETASFLGAT